MNKVAHSWRPPAGGFVALSDHELSQIGLIAVMEATAKSVAAASLRAVKKLSYEDWIKLERVQFAQIMQQLIAASDDLDYDLTNRLNELEAARVNGQDMRHAIMHATWGQAGAEDSAVAYDNMRKVELNAEYIEKALLCCADMRHASLLAAVRVAELVEQGILTERPAGAGISVRTANRSVRL